MEKNIGLRMFSSEDALKKEVKGLIESLEYSAEETKAIYFQQLGQCESYSELQELISVIEIGEQQLREIERSLFQALETYVWRINEFKCLPMNDKTQWVEKIVACDFPENMADVFSKALAAEKEASKNIREASRAVYDGWTISIDYQL
ncbi:hypothetical protein [Enterococcus sp. AZ196]|uniref:hypothetical protein n=1 Tax=Enterococcus sp. AZ196 TaxID=2774659 RepID=UPI003D294DCC